jgi:hypothetical protein
MNYPKTSCPCQGCPQPASAFYQKETINDKPCSLGISNCEKSPGFYCSNKQVYKQNIQPNNEPTTYQNLNTLGLSSATDYTQIDCKNFNGGCAGGYAGHNPKLFDSARAQLLLLDRPHLSGGVAVGNVCHDEIYTPYFRNYGKNYTSYKDINAGQIQYYVDSDTSGAYFRPNFPEPALVTHEVFIDPMGSIKPQYNRETFQKYGWDSCNKDNCDSFTHDTLEFRQELMEKQMRKINQQRWQSRY